MAATGRRPPGRRRGPLPERATLLAADARSRVRWARTERDEREEAIARCALKLRDSGLPWRPRAVAAREAVAWGRSHAYELRAELRARTRVDGLDGLPERAILCAVHSTSMWIALYGVARAGVPLHPVVDDWFWSSPLAAQRRGAVEAAGGTIVRRRDAARDLPGLVAGGGRPVLLVDVPGRCPVPFLGKTARIQRGAARLATGTGAALVPVDAGWRGAVPVATLGAPIAAGDDEATTMGGLVAALEEPLRRRPENLLVYTPDLWPREGAAVRWAFDGLDDPAAPAAAAASAGDGPSA